jgi:peptide/nickel transport system substrate-binding protein
MTCAWWRVGVVVSLAMTVAAPAWAGKENDTLNIAWREELPSYDAYYASPRESVLLARLVWDNLVDRDPVTFEYKPLLAESYEWIDQKTLEFRLRKGITFHNGEPFNADDVVYTLNRVSSPEAAVVNPKMVNWIGRAEKVDDYTVRVLLDEPFPAALEYLAAAVPIYPNEYYEKVGPEGMSANPVGTGPYAVTESVPGKTITLVRNDSYFDGSPKGAGKIGKIVQRTIPDPQTQVAELLAGRLDWIWLVPPDIAERLASRPGIQVEPGETMRIGYIDFDATGASGVDYFKDKRVRQAVNHAINRQAIATNLIGEGSTVINSACYPSQFGCEQNVNRYEYDPEKAKALLAEAGYPDGFDVDIYGYRERQVTEAIIGDLQNVGIRAKLNWVRFATFKEMNFGGKIALRHGAFGSWSINDVSITMEGFFQGVEEDTTRDQQLIEWNREAGQIVDQERRKELYSMALNRVAAEAYWVPLHTYVTLYAFSADLNFKPQPDEVARFYLADWK